MPTLPPSIFILASFYCCPASSSSTALASPSVRPSVAKRPLLFHLLLLDPSCYYSTSFPSPPLSEKPSFFQSSVRHILKKRWWKGRLHTHIEVQRALIILLLVCSKKREITVSFAAQKDRV